MMERGSLLEELEPTLSDPPCCFILGGKLVESTQRRL